jgi:single-strand DNA-binding protein
MSLSITGTVAEVFPTEQVSAKFSRRIVVLEIPGTFPQQVPFEFTQDRCDLADRLTVGAEATIYFDLKGRKWQEKWYPSIHAWKVETQAAPAPAPKQAPEPESGLPESETLPF